jgi:hypothetical protein
VRQSRTLPCSSGPGAPLTYFGIRKLIEGLMIQRLGENDKIVTRYVEDQDFQNAAFDGLADEIFDSVLAGHS